jgi:hypothetical protein
MKIPSSSTRCQCRPATGKRLGANASIDVAVLRACCVRPPTSELYDPRCLRSRRLCSGGPADLHIPALGGAGITYNHEGSTNHKGQNYTSNLHPDLLDSAETDPLAWSSTGIESQLLVFNVRFAPPRFSDRCAIMLVRDPALGSRPQRCHMSWPKASIGSYEQSTGDCINACLRTD